MTALQSQVLGLLLAIATAAGCIAYEKLVEVTSIRSIIFLALLFYLPFMVVLLMMSWSAAMVDVHTIVTSPKLTWCAVIYYASWITTPVWWILTRKQGVMAASLYEIKYIVVLAVMYALVGDKQLTWNTGLAVMLALGSIYFVSKT